MNGITRRAAVLLITAGMALIAGAGVAHATPTPDDHTDKVWVCKYVDKPGVAEVLKDGKNPINVDDSATNESEQIGASFADAQGRSVIVAGEDSECPVSEVTTTTTIPETTTSSPVSTSTTTVAPTTTTTKSSPGTTTPRRGTTVLTPSSPSSSPGSPTLPFTGTSTLPLLVTGLGLLAGGVALVLRGKAVRG